MTKIQEEILLNKLDSILEVVTKQSELIHKMSKLLSLVPATTEELEELQKIQKHNVASYVSTEDKDKSLEKVIEEYKDMSQDEIFGDVIGLDLLGGGNW